MAGLGECPFGPLHPEDEEATEIRLRHSKYREGAGSDSCLTYTSRYFSLYERPGVLFENTLRTAKSIAELSEENVLGLISRTLFIAGRVVYPPRDKVLCRLQVPTGDPDTDHHMLSMVKSTDNLAIQKFRSLANWIFHSVYDFLGSMVPKKLKRRVEIWLSGGQRTSVYRNLALESEQLLSVVRMAAVNNEARYYMLRKARYPENRAEDMRRRDIEVARSTAWALARNEAAALDSNGYPYSPTSPARDTGDRDESSGDELFGR